METRIVTVASISTRSYDYGRKEAFDVSVNATDDAYPRDYFATTFDPFVADTLNHARQSNQAVWLTVDMGYYGLDIIRVETLLDREAWP